MRTIAIKSVNVSDISGVELKNDDLVEVVVRDHPKVPEGCRLDAATGELEALKTVNNIVRLELRYPDGTTKDVLCTVTELEKLVPVDVLTSAPGLRGRKPGYRPGGDR